MLFVPLPLFATLLLCLLLARFLFTRDMRLPAHRYFALLIALYAAQTLLVSLRWGYGIDQAAVLMILLAPLLPTIAYLAYRMLSGQPDRLTFWPLWVVAFNWLLYLLLPAFSDASITLTYVGFGLLLLRMFRKGADHLSMSPLGDARGIWFAMLLTGAALIGSGLMDVYVVYDFMRNDGRNIGAALTFVQTAFVLIIGVSGVFGRAAPVTRKEAALPQTRPEASEADSDIVARLEDLFTQQKLHRQEDLSVRRLSRRIGVPDRQLSNAVNRVRGVSVSQFVNGFRIKDACALLKHSDRSILEVSLAAGFATKSNFIREFVRIVGQTPSQWRSENSPEQVAD